MTCGSTVFPIAVTERLLKLLGDARVVTFANGLVLRERIVDIDDSARRMVYASVGGRATHHQASMQVFAAEGGNSRLVWITDVLPVDLAVQVRQAVGYGAAIMLQTLARPTDTA